VFFRALPSYLVRFDFCFEKSSSFVVLFPFQGFEYKILRVVSTSLKHFRISRVFIFKSNKSKGWLV